MAKIRFENGTVVNFEGNPTPQDIEEVASKLNIQKPQQEQPVVQQPEKKEGLFQSLLKNVAVPLIKSGGNPITAFTQSPIIQKTAVESAGGLFSDVKSSIEKRGQTFAQQSADIAEQIRNEPRTVGAPPAALEAAPQRALSLLGQGAGAIMDIGGAIIGKIGSAGASTLNTITPGNFTEDIKTNVSDMMNKIGTIPVVLKGTAGNQQDIKIADIVNGGMDYWQKFKQKFPTQASDIENTINIAALLWGPKKAKETTESLSTVTSKLPEIKPPKVPTPKIPTAIQDRTISRLEADYEKWGSATKSGARKVSAAEAKTEAMNVAGTTGKTPSRTLAESKIIPETEGTKFKTAQQAEDFRESLQPLHDANASALSRVETQTQPILIDNLEKNAISNSKKIRTTPGEAESIVQDIKNEMAALRRKYGDSIKITDLNVEKSNYWGATRFDATKPFKSDTNYQIAKAMQKTIEETASAAGFKDIAQLNREIGDRLGAARFLESLDGQTLKYGKLGKYVFMGIGATLGKTLVGKVLGAIGGDLIGQMLINASVSTPVKRLLLSQIATKSPEAYQATLRWLQQQGKLQELRLALPAPSFIPIQPTTGTPSFGNPQGLFSPMRVTGETTFEKQSPLIIRATEKQKRKPPHLR